MTQWARAAVVVGVACLLAAAAPGCGGAATGPVATDAPTTDAPTTVAPTTVAPTTVPPAGPPPAVTDPSWAMTTGDGRWSAAGRPVEGVPAVWTTVLHRHGATYGVAWMDQRRLQTVLYAGTSQPPGMWTHDGAVGAADASTLVAAFNSGFKLAESRGGWYADGREGVPLVVGAASLVVHAGGTATIGVWGQDAQLDPDVVAVRQNLQLLVDRGSPTPASASTDPIHVWGDPLHENPVTWRSAVAVDRGGQLLYVAGTASTPADLAAAVVAAGGVRAMQLDINPQWVSFDAFSTNGAPGNAVKLLPAMVFPSTHFLQPYFRDFFAVFAP